MLAGAYSIGLLLGLALIFLITRGINRGLQKVISELGEAAHQVAGAASQISGGAQSLAPGSLRASGDA